MRLLAFLALMGTAMVSPGTAEEKPIQLKDAPGLDKVETNCASCHSLDYVLMNSPFPNSAVWEATISKMIKAFGAPIDEDDAKVIGEYLKKNYGR